MVRSFQGKRPQVDREAFVAENAALIGDVVLEKDSSVWYGAVLRGDQATIRLGEGSNVQDNATLHCFTDTPLIIGKNVTIGHNAVVHCKEVGDNSLVGMGSILMNRVVIGKNCIVGAGAVVTQDTVVPEGTMMLGVPAKPVRKLTETEIAELKREKAYVRLGRIYREEAAAEKE